MAPAFAEDGPAVGDDPGAPAPLAVPGDGQGGEAADAGQSAAAEEERLDELFADLAEPGRKDWEKVEGNIEKIWAHSGSPAMDLLLARGNKAMAAEDYGDAIDHFSALIDHAPNFAEGWNARATAYFLEGNFALAMTDVEHVLVLNPRHFGALTGLSAMFEAMDEPRLALEAARMAEKLSPNRPSIKEAIGRLERQAGEADL